MRLTSACLPIIVVAAVLATGPALAQGTDAQREACAPDAVKLCQNTIPDIPKTTACMKRHFSELTPACQTAFNDATGPSRKAKQSSRVATREERAPAPPAAAAPADDVDAGPERVPGLRAYESDIRKICRDGLVDAFTCRNTLDALKASE